MERYRIYSKEGYFITERLTREEAQKCVEKMEEGDKEQGEYEPDCYDIVEVI